MALPARMTQAGPSGSTQDHRNAQGPHRVAAPRQEGGKRCYDLAHEWPGLGLPYNTISTKTRNQTPLGDPRGELERGAKAVVSLGQDWPLWGSRDRAGPGRPG